MKSQINVRSSYERVGKAEIVRQEYHVKSNFFSIAKRCGDIIVSFLIIALVLWWLIPILALLIKLDSKGPVFFVQKRIGFGGVMFNCFKLRTMLVNEHADTKQARKNDPRITTLGKILRISCLDELPQFFNVLTGDMSLIGPRPHMIKDCEEFTKYVPDYDMRHSIRPGITGMAQVKGYRGKTKDFFDIFHRYQWDIFYLRNASFVLDVKIMFRTVEQTILSAFSLLKKGRRNSILTESTVVTDQKPAVYSIVIIAKDAGHKMERLLNSIRGLSDDIVLCDTGSSDNTVAIAEKMGIVVHSIPWQGYGKSKNMAIGFAKHDWILSLDSDEKIDELLYEELKSWKPKNNFTVYQVLWKNFLGNDWIRHSDWQTSWKNRLFNKHFIAWDDSIAHEDIIAKGKLSFQKMDGYLEHYSFRNNKEYKAKMINSARLTSMKYFEQNKSSTFIHLAFSPFICFVKTYFFRLGFLDGKNGWLIATTSANYTYMKYYFLRKLNKHKITKNSLAQDNFLVHRVLEF